MIVDVFEGEEGRTYNQRHHMPAKVGMKIDSIRSLNR
jgi:hypothetical protein